MVSKLVCNEMRSRSESRNRHSSTQELNRKLHRSLESVWVVLDDAIIGIHLKWCNTNNQPHSCSPASPAIGRCLLGNPIREGEKRGEILFEGASEEDSLSIKATSHAGQSAQEGRGR